METLGMDVGDMIQIRTTSLELAKMVKLQPQSVNFLEISDPKAVLERAFRNFATLTKGDVFNFEYNDEIYEVAVLDVKPETDKMGVSMIETDVSVDFAPPVGYVEPERRSGANTPGSSRSGAAAGGVLHGQGTMAQAIGFSSIAPSVTSKPTNFLGEGQRLVKKGSKTSTPKPATPAPAETAPAAAKSRTGAPAALRLAPNKLLATSTSPSKPRRRRNRKKLRISDRVSLARVRASAAQIKGRAKLTTSRNPRRRRAQAKATDLTAGLRGKVIFGGGALILCGVWV